LAGCCAIGPNPRSVSTLAFEQRRGIFKEECPAIALMTAIVVRVH